MAEVGLGDIKIWKGADAPPIVWEFLATDIPDDQLADSDDLFQLEGSILYLTVGRGSDILVQLNTEDDDELVLDVDNAKLTWTPSVDDTRDMPNGRVLKYEIERRIDGKQSPLAAGFVVVEGGLNDD